MLLPILPTFDAARSSVPEALVGRGEWSRARAIAARLPNAAVMHYLECRLAAGVNRVDYQITSKLSAGSGPVLAGWRAGRGWKCVESFFRIWNDESSALHRIVPIAGLEFDLDLPTPDVPRPQVIFCIDPAMDRSFDRRLVLTPSEPAFRAAIVEGLTTLFEQPLAPATEELFGRCFDALPAEGRILHVAAFIGRPGRVIRCVAVLPREAVFEYLDALGWQGPRQCAHEASQRFGRPDVGHMKLDIDIDGEVLPKFALAVEFTTDGADGYARALPLLDELCRAGLCTRAKRDALAAWPGRGQASLPGYGWPLTLERHMDFKVVVWPDEQLEAKVYLGIQPRFVLF